MRVPRRGRHLPVSEQLPDRGQALAQRQRPRRIRVTQIMDPDILKPGLCPDGPPVGVEVRQTGPRPLSGKHPGSAVEHRGQRPGQGHHARTRLGVPEPQLARRAVHVVPTQGQALALPASGQHQQPERCDCRRPHRAVRLRVPQHTAQPPELLRRQKPLARPRLVTAHRPARVPSERYPVPRLGQREHFRQDIDHRVGHCRRVAKPVMQRRNLSSSDLADRHPAQDGKNVLVEHAPVRCNGARLAMHLDMDAHEPFGQFGHGELRVGRHRHGNLAPLDAVDDHGRPLPRLIGRQVPMTPEGHTLRPGRPPGLNHVDLAAGGMDPHPEARQVPIPEDGILGIDGECIDGELGDPELASSGHGRSRQLVSCAGGCEQSVIKKHTTRHQIAAYLNTNVTGTQGSGDGRITEIN